MASSHQILPALAPHFSRAHLATLAALPSSSTTFPTRPSSELAAAHITSWAANHGTARSVAVGYQELPSGTTFAVPPVVLVTIPAPSPAPTLLVYASYDMPSVTAEARALSLRARAADAAGIFSALRRTRSQPALDGDDGRTLPFWEGRDRVLHGFGLVPKGALAAWMAAVDAFAAAGMHLPVNLKLVVEGMGASASECLADLLAGEEARFLKDVDFVVASEGTWPAPGAPVVVSKARGAAVMDVQVSGGGRVLASGAWGGGVAEPLADLVRLLAVAAGGEDGLVPEGAIEEEDRAALANVAVAGLAQGKAGAGRVNAVIGRDDVDVLARRSLLPAVTIHGIEGAYAGSGVNSIIPAVVSGKLTVHYSPGMSGEAVAASATAKLHAAFDDLDSPNNLNIVTSIVEPWVGDTASPFCRAVRTALSVASGNEPVDCPSGTPLLAVNEIAAVIPTAPVVVVPLFSPVPTGRSGVVCAEDDPISRAGFTQAISIVAAIMTETAALRSGNLGATEAAPAANVVSATSPPLPVSATTVDDSKPAFVLPARSVESVTSGTGLDSGDEDASSFSGSSNEHIAAKTGALNRIKAIWTGLA